jgi:tellurite resistance protein TerB
MSRGTTTRDRHAALRADLLVALMQLRSEALLNATVAACALVAHADGEVAPTERQRVLALMRTDPLLSMFAQEVVQRAFAAQECAFERDPEAAKAAALRQIAPLAERPRHARVVFDACRVMTAADTQVHPTEEEALRRIGATLGLADTVAGGLG